MPSKQSRKNDNGTDCPVVWFAVLEGACTKGDADLIEEAQKNLKRLGVSVEYTKGGDDGK